MKKDLIYSLNLRTLKSWEHNMSLLKQHGNRKKQDYDSIMLGTDSELSNLETEVKKTKGRSI